MEVVVVKQEKHGDTCPQDRAELDVYSSNHEELENCLYDGTYQKGALIRDEHAQGLRHKWLA